MRGIYKFRLFFFQINGGSIDIHTVQSDSNNIGLFSFHFYRKSVGLSSGRTIDTYPFLTNVTCIPWLIKNRGVRHLETGKPLLNTGQMIVFGENTDFQGL